MIFGSLFSGIEAASCAWLPLGWRCAWVAEIDPFASAVLKHHYPDVPNLGDVNRIDPDAIEPVDLVVGGPPCQDFSVAGNRAGIEGERGNLSLEYVRALDAIDPLWCLTENVPGWLSMRDNAFGHFLGRLVGHDSALVPGRGQRWTDSGVVAGPRRTAAWRILDAQYFGVPQRRRRVFVLAARGAGNLRCAAALFPLGQSVPRNFAPRRQAGQNAPTIPARSTAGGGLGTDFDCDGGLIAACWTARDHKGPDSDTKPGHLVVPPLMARGHSNGRAQTLSMGFQTDEHIICFSAKDHGADAGDTAPTLRAGGHDRSHANAGVMPAIAGHFEQNSMAGRGTLGWNDGDQPLRPVKPQGDHQMLVTHSLRADSFDAGEDGTGRGTPLVAVPPLDMRQISHGEDEPRPNGSGCGVGNAGDPAYTVTEVAHAVAYGIRSDAAREGQGMSVRRLTPGECLKLQGFPPDWLDIQYRGKPAADGNKYRATGNSMAVPVVAWLGRRIRLVSDTNTELPDAAE